MKIKLYICEYLDKCPYPNECPHAIIHTRMSYKRSHNSECKRNYCVTKSGIVKCKLVKEIEI